MFVLIAVACIVAALAVGAIVAATAPDPLTEE